MTTPSRFDVTLLPDTGVRVRVFELRGAVFVVKAEANVYGRAARAVLNAAFVISIVLSTDTVDAELSLALEAIADIAREKRDG